MRTDTRAAGSSVDPLDLLLQQAVDRCTDPLVRRWLQGLLERGEFASSADRPDKAEPPCATHKITKVGK